MRYMSVIDRFLDKAMPEPNSGCWLWIGACDASSGYGNFGMWPKTLKAHRVAYMLFKGPIPDGMHIDHKCSVRCCVNPDHLDAVSLKENNRRTWDRGRGVNVNHRKKEHCPQGHSYKGKNIYFAPDGTRQCMICRREHQAKLRQKRRASVDLQDHC